MRRVGVLMIVLGLVLFLGARFGQDMSLLSWTGLVDHWGQLVGNMIRTVLVMLGIVLALSSK